MAATLDDELANLRRINAELERKLADRTAERDEAWARKTALADENARLLTETREALEQQTATAEVLQVINSSPGDLRPVFDAMLDKALGLCGAAFGCLWTYDGERVHAVALRGTSADFARFLTQTPHPVWPDNAHGRLLQGEPVVHIADIAADAAYRTGDPVRRNLVELGGGRTLLAVPLRKDDAFIGDIVIYRQKVRPFSEKQIALLQNFAAQAVIAMENARLLTETREALEQQTATAEVLQVINSSPGELAPVFDAILEKSHALCAVAQGALELYDDGIFRAVATRGLSEGFAQRVRRGYRGVENPITRQLLDGARFIHIPDLAEIDHPMSQAAAKIGGLRTSLFLPLHNGNRLLGQIVASRAEVRPFTGKQIALLQNFAAQAVIAIENARLLTETREALEQQTATAEVLQVINASPGDLAPVFEAILDKAHTLCGATLGSLFLYDGELFRAAATFGYPEDLTQRLRRGVVLSATTQFLDGAPWVHNPDLRLLDAPTARAVSGQGGVRTNLMLPLRKDGRLLGAISCNRREVRPFTDKQIALLQNFGAQAVIAMENVRLLTETREALEQQTATAEVLQAINTSPGNLVPVFDAMLDKALRLCGAAFGQLVTFDGIGFLAAAWRGYESRSAAKTIPMPGMALYQLVQGEQIVHIPDITADEVYRSGNPVRRRLADEFGGRTAIWVALRNESALLGAFVIYRTAIRPFSEKEIALLRSFAAQAVIAMENARLLDEIRQRQAELRVTFDNMGDGVIMFDEGLRLAAWNRNFQEMLDLPDAVLAGRPSYADYLRILAERGEFGGEDIEAELSRRLRDTDRELRLERTRPDGRIVEVRRNAVPDGGFVLIYSDITERKRSEAEIRAARDAAEAAYRDLKAAQASLVQAEKMASLGQLTAGIAHEIKNPLNFVNNFAELSVGLLGELKETAAPAIAALGAEARVEIDDLMAMLTGNLGRIAEHGRRADGIVRSMLEHSRGSSGERRKVDLNRLVDEALNLAYHGARAQDQTFNITLERDFGSPMHPIELVPQDITRVCLNLFSNGLYAATRRERQGGDRHFAPTLQVATRDLGEAVEIRVRDNGAGIPPEDRDKLFQPFFTTKPTGEGTGLGLSISHDIVTQQHGGTIEVDSRVNEFTEFRVRLPHVRRTTLAQAAS